MRRLITVMILLLAASSAYAMELPDSVGEWRCVSECVVPLVLDANGESLGRIVYRDYMRNAPKGFVSVILTEGKGTGSLYVPERVSDSKGVMPSESGYKLVMINGRKAILEHNEHLPAAVAVTSDDTVITIESSSLDDEAVIKFAEDFCNISIHQ